MTRVDLFNISTRESVWMLAEPSCGEDFCDDCGDCLYCYYEDSCPGGYHRWVVYDDHEKWKADHPEARLLPDRVQ